MAVAAKSNFSISFHKQHQILWWKLFPTNYRFQLPYTRKILDSLFAYVKTLLIPLHKPGTFLILPDHLHKTSFLPENILYQPWKQMHLAYLTVLAFVDTFCRSLLEVVSFRNLFSDRFLNSAIFLSIPCIDLPKESVHTLTVLSAAVR